MTSHARLLTSNLSGGSGVARVLGLTIVGSLGLLAGQFAQPLRAANALEDPMVTDFTDRHCSGCHNDVDKEGGLDLTMLPYSPKDPANFMTWVKVHSDRADRRRISSTRKSGLFSMSARRGSASVKRVGGRSSSRRGQRSGLTLRRFTRVEA